MIKPKKLPRDANSLAARIVALSTETAEPDLASGITKPVKAEREKNPAAVALGRLGGLKGGKARSESMTPEQRRKIAQKAAAKRWGK